MLYEVITNPIPEFGWFVAYHHWWADYLRSQIVYSVVNVNNLSIEGDNALHITTFALVNLTYTLFEQMDVITSYSIHYTKLYELSLSSIQAK